MSAASRRHDSSSSRASDEGAHTEQEAEPSSTSASPPDQGDSPNQAHPRARQAEFEAAELLGHLFLEELKLSSHRLVRLLEPQRVTSAPPSERKELPAPEILAGYGVLGNLASDSGSRRVIPEVVYSTVLLCNEVVARLMPEHATPAARRMREGLLQLLFHPDELASQAEAVGAPPGDAADVPDDKTAESPRGRSDASSALSQDPTSPGVPRKKLIPNGLPGKDSVFENYLQVSTADRADADQVKGVARRLFYGSHYPRLFPATTAAGEVSNVASVLRVATLALSDDTLDEGERLADQFSTRHPERLRPYRTLSRSPQ